MQRATPLALVLVLFFALTVAGAAETQQELWTSLVGRSGIFEERDCGYVFTLSTPTQSSNATVKAAGPDGLMLFVRRNDEAWEYVIPYGQITLRRAPAR